MDNEPRFVKYDMDIQRLEDKLDILTEMLSTHDERVLKEISSLKNYNTISKNIDDIKSSVPSTKVRPRKIR